MHARGGNTIVAKPHGRGGDNTIVATPHGCGGDPVPGMHDYDADLHCCVKQNRPACVAHAVRRCRAMGL